MTIDRSVSGAELHTMKRTPGRRAAALCCAAVVLLGAASHAVAQPRRPAADDAAERPTLVVTPDAGSYVVVGAGVAELGPRVGWYIAYLAAGHRDGTTAPGSGERLITAADALFRSQLLVADAVGAEMVSVLALYGAPGEAGAVQQVTYARGPDGWRRTMEPLVGEVSTMPSVPESFEPDPAAESSAVGVAREFLERCDRGDLDAAWDLGSTAVKQTMSRASFEQQLRAAGRVGGRGSRQEVFHAFGLVPFAPGTELEILFKRAGAYEAVQLRMDDDLEWRVSKLRTFAVDGPAQTFAAADAVEL